MFGVATLQSWQRCQISRRGRCVAGFGPFAESMFMFDCSTLCSCESCELRCWDSILACVPRLPSVTMEMGLGFQIKRYECVLFT